MSKKKLIGTVGAIRLYESLPVDEFVNTKYNRLDSKSIQAKEAMACGFKLHQYAPMLYQLLSQSILNNRELITEEVLSVLALDNRFRNERAELIDGADTRVVSTPGIEKEVEVDTAVISIAATKATPIATAEIIEQNTSDSNQITTSPTQKISIPPLLMGLKK